ncbi:IclR family transcriptional regulator [Mycolicibacterium holsaticum]|uniref:IclR family transcriptional regulator n=1 Tax=Mycolicibacterium holsaticum TaxID=152142 RepID=UPI000DA189E5
MARLLDELHAAQSPVGINDLARRTDLPKSTVSRLVAEMTRTGMVDRYAEKVGIGLRVFEWGEHARSRRLTRDAAMPILVRLLLTTRHTIHLAVLDGFDVLYLEILPSPSAPQLPSRVGGRLPAHATGVGKALLAGAPPQVVDALVAAGLPAVGPRTVRHPQLLRRQLNRAATGDLALEHEESGPGISCVAASIRDTSGAAIAAISAAGWTGNMNMRTVAPIVQEAARSIGIRLDKLTEEGLATSRSL